ncbi:MAG: DUF1924 domain-containing protein [Magnetococcales bacterium]|nr:DUF1924 domain-containing protein [Magnetococcales bacterium]
MRMALAAILGWMIMGMSYEVLAAEPTNGEQLWRTPGLADTDHGGPRTCGTCHGNDPKQPGKHVVTGRVIEPMAPSLVPTRYTDADKVETWFLRNCKWTFGRECDAKEKAAILAYLKSW